MEMIVQRQGDLIRFVVKENESLEMEFLDSSKKPHQQILRITAKELYKVLLGLESKNKVVAS